MSDPEIVSGAPSEQDSSVTQDQHASAAAATKTVPGGISFSIWPPTQRTRDAVVNRLIETLSTSSVLSKRYGTMSAEEASAAARQIEDEAFTAAGGSAASDDDGIEILQAYSKEISKRMLDTVKAKGNAGSATVDNGAPAPASEEASAGAEGAPSTESET